MIARFFHVVATNDRCLLRDVPTGFAQGAISADGDVVVTAKQRVGKTMLSEVLCQCAMSRFA